MTNDDIIEMPFGQLVLMLQAHAQTYERDDGPKEATYDQIKAWAGLSL